MSNLSFALTMIVVGMGGTLLTLWLLTGLIHLLRRALPVEPTRPNPPTQA